MIEISNILDVEKYIGDAEAVIFDLDDTLYLEKDYVRSGFQSIADSFKMPELAQKLWDAFEKGGKPIDEVFEAEKIQNREEAITIYRNHKPNIALIPGVMEMLDRVKKSEKKLGLITDGRPEGQRAKILALGIQNYFDKVIITDELGGIAYRKPNPEAFLIMQRVMHVPFNRMVYIGDNISKDFDAPSKLGMNQIFYRNINGIYKSTMEKISGSI